MGKQRPRHSFGSHALDAPSLARGPGGKRRRVVVHGKHAGTPPPAMVERAQGWTVEAMSHVPKHRGTPVHERGVF